MTRTTGCSGRSATPSTRAHRPYFFVPPEALSAVPAVITGPDARHLSAVRRARTGDQLTLSDGAGTVVEATITFQTPERVEVEEALRAWVPRPEPRVEVYVGLSKGDKVDDVVRQLTEIGVDRIGVFLAGRSVPRWEPARAEAAHRRWSALGIEAARQSHRAWLPEVVGPLTLPEAAREVENSASIGLIAHPNNGLCLVPFLSSQTLAVVKNRVWVVTGPEGGLSPEDREVFEAAGGVCVSLGTQILRAETAPLVAATLILSCFGRIG